MDMQRLADFASTPIGQILLVGLGMLLLSRGYPALVARWPGLAPYLGLLARLFPDAAPRSGEALWALYVERMGGRAVNGKPLPAWADLDQAQRAAYEAMAHGLALAPVPPSSSSEPPKAPPGIATMGLVCLALWVSACAGLGCGGSVQKVEAVAHAARDVAVVAEVCSFEAKERMMADCTDDACRAKVLAKYAPIADALDAFHGAWCTLSPDSEGCQ